MNSLGFIFDLDGVIVDTASFHFKAWGQIASELGIEFGEKENELLKGVGRADSLEKILSMGNVKLEADKREVLLHKKNRIYLELVDSLSEDSPLPGAKNFLEESKRSGIKIGIGSSSKNAKRILEKIGLADEFDVIVDGTMIEKSKPDPEVFQKGAEKMGTPPSSCVVFEDAESGVKAAKRAGMYCIGIGSEKNLSDADLVVTDLSKIKAHEIKSLLNL